MGNVLRKSRALAEKFSGAPDALLRGEAGIHHRLVVRFGGVLVESGGGLGAEVAVASVEVERADAVLAADTGEAHAALHSFRRVVSHCRNCSLVAEPARRHRSG